MHRDWPNHPKAASHPLYHGTMSILSEQVVLIPHAMSYRGTAVGRFDGQAVFIRGALPGERVVAEIERAHRNYLEARTVEIVTPSPARVEPRCAHFETAGPPEADEWEFIEYGMQIQLKEEIFLDQLRRVGHFDGPPLLSAVAAPSPWGYRNHVRFAVDADGNPAYLRRASHTPVPVDSCAVLDPWINAALPHLRGRLKGLNGVELRHSDRTGEALIAPSLAGRPIDLPSGQPYYHEGILGQRFRVSAGSFFQVNPGTTEALAHLLLDSLSLSGTEQVADLYAGVGLFAKLLAPRVRSVVAVESDETAVEDGRLNTGFLENVRYRKGSVAQVLPRIVPAPDVVVLDPPRAGCEPAVVAALLRAAPRLIAYISCDPATLARDLRLLVTGGYRLESTRVVDMFPQTYHVESLTLLERGGL